MKLAAVHDSILARLLADATLVSLLADSIIETSPSEAAIYDGKAPQFDEPEDDDNCPYLVIGDMTGVEFDTDSKNGSEDTVTIHIWSRYRGRHQMRQIMDALHGSLHDSMFSIEGAHLVYCLWEFSQTIPESNPRLQHGVMRFRIVSQYE